MRDIISLACTECQRRNYTTAKNKRTHPDRMPDQLAERHHLLARRNTFEAAHMALRQPQLGGLNISGADYATERLQRREQEIRTENKFGIQRQVLRTGIGPLIEAPADKHSPRPRVASQRRRHVIRYQ